ncbi:MAG: glucoamylase family protein [Phycisphaerae bacterium]
MRDVANQVRGGRLRTIAALAGIACGSAGAASDDIIRTLETTRATEYRFSDADSKLLDEVQHSCFQYFWKEVGSPAKLAKDRLKIEVASIAAVGFQLGSLPIGVERKWITREQGVERAATILRSLYDRKDNKKFGMYMHFPDHGDAGPCKLNYAHEASTVDSSILFAGAMAAASYFGGEVADITQKMLHDANWKAFADGPDGFLRMAWHVERGAPLNGDVGHFTKHAWHIASCEEHLIYFLGAGSPNPAHALPPETYYRVSRQLGAYKDGPPFVLSAQGTLFHYFFSHCWIAYRQFDADTPADFGSKNPRVDWFENSRRATLAHRQRCIDLSSRHKTLSENIWGLSAAASRDGYIVPEIMPNRANKEQLFEGTVAPYAAGSAIMFTPAESVAALRAMRDLKGKDGKPFVWRDPAEGGYGFLDSFNLDQNHAEPDYTGIDQGPMIIAIENARTGLIWKLFMQHPVAKAAVERLRWRELRTQ